MKVMAFQGNAMANAQPAAPMTLQPVVDPDLTPSPDVPLAILKRKMMATNDIAAARGYLMEINAHLKVMRKCIQYNTTCFVPLWHQYIYLIQRHLHHDYFTKALSNT